MKIAELFYYRRLGKQFKGKIIEFSKLAEGEEFVFVDDVLPPSSLIRRFRWQPMEFSVYVKVGSQRYRIVDSNRRRSKWVVLWLQVLRWEDYKAARYPFLESCTGAEPCRCLREEPGECGAHPKSP